MVVAYGHLEERRQEINDLNVFPVADGDTGDNMALTLRAVLEQLNRRNGQPLDVTGRDEHDSGVARAGCHPGMKFAASTTLTQTTMLSGVFSHATRNSPRRRGCARIDPQYCSSKCSGFVAVHVKATWRTYCSLSRRALFR